MINPVNAATEDPARSTLADSFRAVMGNVCTPVSVVTTLVSDIPYGTTVSAFASLSMTPPMILVSLDGASRLLAAIQQSRTFGLNVLSDGQQDLALNFARKSTTGKFEDIPWDRVCAVPRIASTSGFAACEVSDIVPGGDHFILLGTVIEATLGPGKPLTYHERRFGTHRPHGLRVVREGAIGGFIL